MFKMYGTIEGSGYISNTYAKYECPISYSKKVMTNVQNQVKGYGQGHMLKKNYGTVGKVLS